MAEGICEAGLGKNGLDFCSFRQTPLASKCSGGARNCPYFFNWLRALHRMRAVERSGECRAQENVSGCCGEDAGAKLLQHNPRKQRKNPAAAGSGERFLKGKWRSGRDSNPRDGFPPAPLAGVCLRPLGHRSAGGDNSRLPRKTRTIGRLVRDFPPADTAALSSKPGKNTHCIVARIRQRNPFRNRFSTGFRTRLRSETTRSNARSGCGIPATEP